MRVLLAEVASKSPQAHANIMQAEGLVIAEHLGNLVKPQPLVRSGLTAHRHRCSSMFLEQTTVVALLTQSHVLHGEFAYSDSSMEKIILSE